MTIKDLNQYAWLKREVTALIKRIEQLNTSPVGMVADTVAATSTGHPYTPVTITVKGLGGSHKRTVAKLNRMLKLRIQQAQDHLVKLEELINSIDNSEVRQIADCRYVKGLQWGQICQELYGGHAHNSAARNKLIRYLKHEKGMV